MSKAQKISKAIDWIAYAAGAYFVGTAIAGAIKKHREKNSGTNGIGAADGEYVVEAYWRDERYGNVRIFAGYTYNKWNGEKWAKWYDPTAQWSEYEEKIYKTRKGAEKAIQELVAIGEDSWNGYPVELSVITWDEYVNRYIRR